MFGNLDSEDVLDLVLEMCDFIIGFEGEIPGAAPEQCGNYQEQNLDMAKYYIKKYKDALVNDRHLVLSGIMKVNCLTSCFQIIPTSIIQI